MGVSWEWEIGGDLNRCAGLWWGQNKQHGAVVCDSSPCRRRGMGGQSWFLREGPGAFISVVGEPLLSHPKQMQQNQAPSSPLWTLPLRFTSVVWFYACSHFFPY